MFNPMTVTTTTPSVSPDAETRRQAADVLPDPDVIGTFTAWVCNSCGCISDVLEGPVYDCGKCRPPFNFFSRKESRGGCSNKCPGCGNYGKRISDQFCQECCAGQVERKEVVECPNCLDYIVVEEWANHWNEDHVGERVERHGQDSSNVHNISDELIREIQELAAHMDELMLHDAMTFASI
ncbi:MAG: hypothetical protein H7145_01995 [Akkermansiaceae bacterium]|nr:hypothetical protein [Armatimonadota bacterium]